MIRMLKVAVLVLLAVTWADRAFAQDSKSAAATRKKMQQKVTLNVKEVGIKSFLLDELVNALDQEIRFKIDNANGLSNNMKVSYSGKDVTVKKVLNDLSDQYDFGYYVISNAANNKIDGTIAIRRIMSGKERGYEAGKEPKKTDGAKDKQSSLPAPAPGPLEWRGIGPCLRGTLATCPTRRVMVFTFDAERRRRDGPGGHRRRSRAGDVGPGLPERRLSVVRRRRPDPMVVARAAPSFELGGLHVSRRLARTMRCEKFHLTIDRAFGKVIRGCADRDGGTWITRAMIAAYERLHRLGVAHSVEAWQGEELMGGIYGVALGGFFSGESMFSRTSDASKVALIFLARHLNSRGFLLFDTQVLTGHTRRMGAVELPRRAYLHRLRNALRVRTTFN